MARARTAALLGRLLLDGFTDETLPLVRALPALADALPDMTSDQLAARHHQVLILGVPPFESLFVGDTVSLGGDTSGAAATTWAAIGMKVVRHDIEADHFGLALRALGLLCAAEHDALRDDVDVARLRAREFGVVLNMPVGFGVRRRTLKNLVEGAAGHEQLGLLADAMGAELDVCAEQLAEIAGGDSLASPVSCDGSPKTGSARIGAPASGTSDFSWT